MQQVIRYGWLLHLVGVIFHKQKRWKSLYTNWKKRINGAKALSRKKGFTIEYRTIKVRCILSVVLHGKAWQIKNRRVPLWSATSVVYSTAVLAFRVDRCWCRIFDTFRYMYTLIEFAASTSFRFGEKEKQVPQVNTGFQVVSRGFVPLYNRLFQTFSR